MIGNKGDRCNNGINQNDNRDIEPSRHLMEELEVMHELYKNEIRELAKKWK